MEDGLTSAAVYGLTRSQVENITASYLLASKEGSYHSGRVALAEALGRSMDSLELELLEDAAKHLTPNHHFRTALVYAHLAYRFPELLTAGQREAVTRPWRSR